jgi:hypothetical protein
LTEERDRVDEDLRRFALAAAYLRALLPRRRRRMPQRRRCTPRNSLTCSRADNWDMSAVLKASKQEDKFVRSNFKKERQGWFARANEWFLELPVPIVLGAMWLAGVGLMSVGVLSLHLFWLALISVVAGG